MPRAKKTPSDFTWDAENIFRGTAWYYARFRPGYPNEVANLLVKKFALTKDSRVLDLGCGTGQMALKLAPYVSEVIAIDPQEEMLREGKSAAAPRGITNVTWIKGDSSRLPQIAKRIGDVHLTVIARAFHWMVREQTLTDLFKITLPGGGATVIDDSGAYDGATLPWKEVIRETVKKWLGTTRRAGTKGTYTPPTRKFEDYLKESEFCNFESASFQVERNWSLDEIIGYMYSTSQSSIPVLGDKQEPFEAELRKRLIEIQPTGRFHEPVTVNVMMVWKSST
jgi:ubiquinone/menaquinone biosynthesis C-methylase UbiE